MTNQRRKKSDLGVLRCMVCGNESARVPRGLNYGFPKCCGQNMRVIPERVLQEERDFSDRYEQEEKYMSSAGVAL